MHICMYYNWILWQWLGYLKRIYDSRSASSHEVIWVMQLFKLTKIPPVHRILQTTEFQPRVGSAQCSDGKLLIDTSQTFSETFQLSLIQTNRTSELLASQLVFLISRAVLISPNPSARKVEMRSVNIYSTSNIIVKPYPSPNPPVSTSP